jgi:hypothetical protein
MGSNKDPYSKRLLLKVFYKKDPYSKGLLLKVFYSGSSMGSNKDPYGKCLTLVQVGVPIRIHIQSVLLLFK